MRIMRVLAACAVLAATASVAQANIILVNGTPQASFTDLGAQGFGAAPRMLTLQTTGVETGSVTPVDQVQGDAVPGANKSTTPTLDALDWTSGSQVGIGFNSDQIGGSGITMQSLVLTIYNGTTVVDTFSLAAPITFTAADLALQQGNGQSVFNFGLDAAQQAEFDALLLLAGSSGFYAGLGSSLGCPAGSPASCLVSNDGPDSFLGFSQGGTPPPVPDGGATVTLLGSALFALGMLRRRLRK